MIRIAPVGNLARRMTDETTPTRRGTHRDTNGNLPTSNALLAEDLCWRQHQVFADAGRLSGRIAVMPLMPLINLAQLQTRVGHGELAYSLLCCLNDAADTGTRPTSTAASLTSRP